MSKLKQIKLTSDMQRKRQELEAAEATGEKLRQQREDYERRSADTEEAIDEVDEETPQEDKEALEATTEQLIAEGDQLEAEETANEELRSRLQEEIRSMEQQLEEMNARAREAVKPQNGAAGVFRTERKGVWSMDTRKIFGLTYEQREALFARNDNVRSWMDTVRRWAKQDFSEKRGVENGELMIPRELLGLVTDQSYEASKLVKHVNLQQVSGRSRTLVDGDLPEAVWMEACGKLNELDLHMYMVEMDGFKVGGFVPVCNSVLEDATDPVALGTVIVDKLGKSIGYALDKAIVFGTGVKMPLGIVTRINQTEAPAGQTEQELPWKNIKSTNYMQLSGTGMDTPERLFASIVEASGAANSRKSSGGLFWVMNQKGKTNLLAQAVAFNSAGAIVAGMNDSMPVVGGKIEVLDFMPDNLIVGGYGSNYTLAQRAGTSLGRSEHVRFIEDQTVFRGTARYDGKPVIADSFVAIGMGSDVLATLNITFAEDKANA